MNHPFPSVIPILRKLYAGRFTSVLFLVPFYRCDEPDVLTVYRGSYTHAAYLTDVRERLAAVDCDHYLVVHDDVLLNPALSEATFRQTFPLGEREGYISHLFPVGGTVGDWTWLFGFAPKALHPKSHLFGSGIEGATLRQYLPGHAQIAAKFAAHGILPQRHARLRSDRMPDVERHPSRTLLHGYAATLDPSDARQAEVERHCLDAARALVEAMRHAEPAAPAGAATPPASGEGAEGAGPADAAEPVTEVELPMPVVGSGYYADLYVLPKACFDDFVHFIGVASAANFFVELMVPTLLVTCCDKVWTAETLGLDASGFAQPATLEAFRDPRFLAIHPFKLSQLSSPVRLRQFEARVHAVLRGEDYPGDLALPGLHVPGLGCAQQYLTTGWHGEESWGRWSAEPRAEVRFLLEEDDIASLELLLMAPVHARLPVVQAQLVVNGETCQALSFDVAHVERRVVIPRALLRTGGNTVDVVVERTVRPCDLDPASPDARELGLALREIQFHT
ncbi:hypothetical protein [Piscinibacter sakaiensis]|nr:hypothetical protein [Piscinibacter sakaiensis]